ncbi:hypothetical protein G6F50_018362 [Rhizopus delemar]|uniref:Uncharacterized protein n=1 Tax=Rhizopus delemar TaxID=936053 RepID=A0A9P6XN23_9FUNG|nr:hypothetical protein G6F50_018362 [Rhizopus delemar]
MYDHIEVLRGAAGMMTGAGNPSGTINLVRKRATAVPQFSVTTSAGSWDNYRGEVDGSGPIRTPSRSPTSISASSSTAPSKPTSPQTRR